MDIKAEIEFKKLIKRVAYNDVSINKLSLGMKHKIGDVGAIAIAEALKTNESITDLYLGCNEIGDVGVIALAEALKTNMSITDLYVSDKQVVDEGIVALVDIESAKARNRKISKVLFNYEVPDKVF
jgi:hypothetical protein